MKKGENNMYLGIVRDLSYELYAVGKTEKECKTNIRKAFDDYLKGYDYANLDEFLEDHTINLEEYGNDVLTMLEEYYGLNIFDVTKGYALGWE